MSEFTKIVRRHYREHRDDKRVSSEIIQLETIREIDPFGTTAKESPLHHQAAFELSKRVAKDCIRHRKGVLTEGGRRGRTLVFSEYAGEAVSIHNASVKELDRAIRSRRLQIKQDTAAYDLMREYRNEKFGYKKTPAIVVEYVQDDDTIDLNDLDV